MSEQPAKKSNKKTLVAMSAVGLVAMGGLVWFLTRPQSVMVTETYKYFPQDTAFFIEAAPSDKVAGRLVRGIDRLSQMNGEAAGHTSISGIFEKDFKPELGIGVWAPKATETATDAEKAPTLVVMTLKEGVTPEKLAKDLNTSMSDFTVEKVGDSTIMESKSHDHAPLAFHKNHLLTANTTGILKQAIAEFETEETLLENPLYKANIGRLPAKRQGTLLALSQEFQKFPQDAVQADSPIKKIQEQMAAATPVTVGSIVMPNEQRVDLEAYTPVEMSKIEDKALRDDLIKLYQSNNKMDITELLPKDTVVFGGMAGLGNYYDIYLNHFADDHAKQVIESTQTQLKMFGLDFRKNLISLFDGITGVGVITAEGQPDVLLFLNGSKDTEKTMAQVSALASQMLRGQLSEKQVDSQHSYSVFNAPGMPFTPAYSVVKSKTLVLGTQPGLEQMYKVDTKKSPSIAENPLYKELSASMPASSNGIFFIDVTKGGALLDRMANRASAMSHQGQQPSVEKMLSGVEGIAGSNSIEGTSLIRGHLSVKLTPEGPTAHQ